jgi:TolA-binding protein
MFCLLLGVVLIASCQRLTEEEAWNKARQSHDEKKFQEAIGFYQLLADRYPQSARASLAYYAIGSIYGNDLKDYANAIKFYLTIVEKYPESKEAPSALFTVGFTYNNDLKDYAKAKLYYEKFLEKYPQHEMAPSARFELATLGRDPNEILSTGMRATSTDSIQPKK